MDRKKKLILTAAGAGAALLAAAVAAAVNFAALNHFFRRTFTSPESYYQYVEKQNIKNSIPAAGGCYEDCLKTANLYDKSSTWEMTVLAGDKGKEILSEARSYGVDLTWLESAGLRGEYSVKDNVCSMGFGLSANLEELFNTRIVMDLDEKICCMQVPELTETYVGIKLAPYLAEYSQNSFDIFREALEQNEKALKNLPKTEDLERLWDTYLNLAVDCLEKVTLESTTIQAGNLKKKCYRLAVTAAPEDMAEICGAVLGEAEQDETLQAVFEAASSVYGLEDGSGASYEDFLEMLRKLQKDYSGAAASGDGSEVFVMKLYLDAKGAIQGRTLVFGNEEVQFGLLMPEQDGEFGYELYFEDSLGERIELTGNGKEKAHILQGDFELAYNHIAFAELELEELDLQAVREGYTDISLTIAPTDLIRSYLMEAVSDGSAAAALLEEGKLRIDFEGTERLHKITMDLLSGEEMVFSLRSIGETMEGKDKGAAEENVIFLESQEDIFAWMGEISMGTLAENLNRAGAPDEWVSAAEQIEGLLQEGYLEMLPLYGF